MFSGEGEEVPFCETLYPTGNVEDWLLEVERVMRGSLKKIIEDSLINYKEVKFNNYHFDKGQVKHPCVIIILCVVCASKKRVYGNNYQKTYNCV